MAEANKSPKWDVAISTMIATRSRLATVEEYDALPEGPPYYQLIDSELVMTPPPIPAHQDSLGNLYFALRSFLKGHPVAHVHLAPFDVRLGPKDIYEPDLFVVLNENPGMMDRKGFLAAPDIAIELLSPSTARYDRGHKKDTDARMGVKEYWIIDLTQRTIECHTNSGQAFALTSFVQKEGTFESGVLKGFSITLEELFENT